jgi:hypothetical protein
MKCFFIGPTTTTPTPPPADSPPPFSDSEPEEKETKKRKTNQSVLSEESLPRRSVRSRGNVSYKQGKKIKVILN